MEHSGQPFITSLYSGQTPH